MRRLLLILALTASLTSCGYDGHYRYPCQDPANWETEDCKPPICTSAGACPEDLVGETVLDEMTNTTEETSNE